MKAPPNGGAFFWGKGIPETTKRLDGFMAVLRSRLVAMGDVAQSMVRDSVAALVDRNAIFIRQVLEHEDEMDRCQIAIDRQVIDLMVLHAPVAHDLRFAIAAARVNTELERVGDLCVNICENAHVLLREAHPRSLADFVKMADLAGRMVDASLQAFLMESLTGAEEVIRADDEVDALNDRVLRGLIHSMMGDSARIVPSLGVILMAGDLERIADHATNIAEMAVYLVNGQDIRHQGPSCGGASSSRQKP